MSNVVKKIGCENYMSLKNIELDLETGCWLLSAKNLDDPDQESNGVGKSSLLDILPICLIGQALDDKSLKECVNETSGSDSFRVYTEMYNSITKDEIYIERKIYNNTKSSELVILVNGELPAGVSTKQGTSGVDIREGSDYILHTILEISKEDLLNYYFTSEKYYTPFLKAGNAEKLKVITRFSNTTKIEKALAKIKSEISEKNTEIIRLNQNLAASEGKIETYQAEISSFNIDELVEKAISSKQATLESYKQDIERHKSKLSELEAQLEQVKTLMLKYNSIDLGQDKENDLNNARLELNELSKIEIQIRGMLNGIEFELKKELIECPNCHHEFRLHATKSDNELQQEMEESAKLFDETAKNKTEITSKIKSLESDITTLREERNKKQQLEYQIKNIETQIGQFLGFISNNVAEMDKLQADIETIKSDPNKLGNIDRFREALKAEKKVKADIKKQVEKTQEELHNLDQWFKNFEDFKFYVSNKPLRGICSNINFNLSEIGSDLSIDIEGFKKLRNGTMKQMLNPTVYRGGARPKSYFNFSAGERARMNIATDLTFQNIINETKPKGGLLFYQSDELFSVIDSLGVSGIASMLDHLNRTFLLVTHSAGTLAYSKTIKLVKENGSTTIL